MWNYLHFKHFNTQLTIAISCYNLVLNIAAGQSCTYLYASDSSQTFDSHLFYGIFDYSANADSCWIIEADYDQVVQLDSESFDLESNCYSPNTGDRVNIYDGDSASDTLDLTVCDNEGVHSHKSTGRYAYVEFKTDNSIEGSGFRMAYKNADAAEEEDPDALSIAVIVGIVIGSLVGVIIIIGVIICCVVIVSSSKKRGGKVHNATPGGPRVVANQAYCPPPQQQMLPISTIGFSSGGMAMMMATGHAMQNATPTAPPPQQYPVDAMGIPMAAVYRTP